MKKVTTFFVGISLLAVSTGVFSYKAMNSNITSYCIRPWVQGQGACTGKLTGSSVNAITLYYTSILIPDCTMEQCNREPCIRLTSE